MMQKSNKTLRDAKCQTNLIMFIRSYAVQVSCYSPSFDEA
jgi:hypothetical protein